MSSIFSLSLSVYPIFYLDSIFSHNLYSLGAYTDGSSDGTNSANCPASDNYIMTPIIGSISNNLVNLLKFSSCSILDMKLVLMDSTRSYVNFKDFLNSKM